MKKSTIYVIVVVLLLVVFAVYIAKFVVKNKEKEKEESPNQGKTGGGNNGSTTDPTLTQNATFPLKLTSPQKKGQNVGQLQNWLNKKAMKTGLYATITVDRIFGPKTEALLQNITGKKEMNLLEFNSNGIYTELSI